MAAEIAAIGILKLDANVIAQVGTRIFPIERPQSSQLPAITVELDSTDPSDTKDGVSTLDTDYISVHCYAGSYKDCITLAGYVRTALDRTSGTYNGVVVQSIQFEGVDTWTEEIENKKIYTIEHNYKVRVVR